MTIIIFNNITFYLNYYIINSSVGISPSRYILKGGIPSTCYVHNSLKVVVKAYLRN